MTDHPHENHDVRFEKEDVNERSTFWFGVWILVVMVAVAFLVKPLYDLFATQEVESQTPAANVLETDPEALAPPSPRLQVTPERDLAAYRAQEDAILTTYAWVDKEHGLARIPVEEAMRIVAERGLPAFSTREGEEAGEETTP